MKRALPILLGVAAVALVATVAGAWIDPRRAAFAYLAAFGVGVGGALGGLALLLIAHATHARWFVVLRRLAEALASTLPLHAVLFLPVALSLRTIYPWARPPKELDPEARHVVLAHAAWLTPRLFVARAYLCIATWIVVAWLLRRASLQGGEAGVARSRAIAAAALPVVALTVTLAAFDWFMSLDATWVSDVYGVYFFAGALASAVGLVAVLAWLARARGVLPAGVSAAHFHALGRVLLTAVAFWAYIAFCQALLVWMADLPREIPYYQARTEGEFRGLSIALAAAHFGVPFAALLSRPLKRRAGALALVGGWVVLAHALDVYWMVIPAMRSGARLLDAAPIVLVIAASLAFGTWRFFAEPPIPTRDPDLARSLRYESP